MATDSNAEDAIIHSYVERVFELSRGTSSNLTQVELQSIALELGLTPQDLARVQKQAQDALTRAQNYIEYDRWDDALAELNTTLAINPFDVEAVYTLAHLHQKRYQQSHRFDDREIALAQAKQCLQLDPNYQAAIALLNQLDRSSQSQQGRLIGVGIASVLALCAGVSLWMLLPIRQPSAPSLNGDEQVEGTPTAPDIESVALDPAEQPVSTANTSETDIAVDFEVPIDVTGLVLDPRFSRFSVYSDSAFYKFKGVLSNNTQTEIQAITAQISYLDEADTTIAVDNVDLLSDHEAPLRPGDSHAFNLIKQLPDDLAMVQLVVRTLDQTPAAANYDPPITVAFTWAVAPPSEIDLAVAQRLVELQEFSSGRAYHKGIFEITNTGQTALQTVKLQIDYFDGAATLLESKDLFVVYSESAPLLPGETRLVNTITDIDASLDRYEITILEAR